MEDTKSPQFNRYFYLLEVTIILYLINMIPCSCKFLKLYCKVKLLYITYLLNCLTFHKENISMFPPSLKDEVYLVKKIIWYFTVILNLKMNLHSFWNFMRIYIYIFVITPNYSVLFNLRQLMLPVKFLKIGLILIVYIESL